MNRLIIILTAVLISLHVTAESDNCNVRFCLADEGDTLQSLTVQRGHIIPLASKPLPQREGFRFAGWFTTPACNPDEEWIFGEKLSSMWPRVVADSMAVVSDMTLYARWVSPTHIKSAEDILLMRENLSGWYVLDNDIDLSGVTEWSSIGTYSSDYEWCDGEWWRTAFKGILDGQGHEITGLRINAEGTARVNAMFGAVANGEIRNLTIDKCKIDIKAKTCYAAPLVGLMKQDGGCSAGIWNCSVKRADISVDLDSDSGTFASVTALAAGCWNGTISDCCVEGNIDVKASGKCSGQLLIGGLLGENFSQMQRCSANVKISADLLPADEGLNAYIGSIAAGTTFAEQCEAEGSIKINTNHGVKTLYVGGITGREQYGFLTGCRSNVKIAVNGANEVAVGGICGGFDMTYSAFGMAAGIFETGIKNCMSQSTFSITNCTSPKTDAMSGTGNPGKVTSPWGIGTMNYVIEP